jgi:hypothetical protein
MAGETAHFNLRNREPTPAVRPFDVPLRLKAMLDGAHAALAEPFRGIAEGSDIVPGLFAPERTGVSLASLLEAAGSFLAALTPEQRKAACFADRRRGLAQLVKHSPLADAPWCVPGRSRR